jgi:hypothetical protein
VASSKRAFFEASSHDSYLLRNARPDSVIEKKFDHLDQRDGKPGEPVFAAANSSLNCILPHPGGLKAD